MPEEPTKKNKIKKVLTVGSLAVMLGAGSVGLASADDCNNQTDQRGDHKDCQQTNRSDYKKDQRSDNDRDRRDNRDKNKKDHKDNKDRKDDRNNRYDREKIVMINGRIISFSSDKMIVRQGMKFYKVKTSSAKFYNRKGEKIDSDDVKSGHMVTIRGTKKSGKTIKAERVRDLSIR